MQILGSGGSWAAGGFRKGGRAGHGKVITCRTMCSVRPPFMEFLGVDGGGRAGHFVTPCTAWCPSTCHWFMKVAAQAMEVVALYDARCPSQPSMGFWGVSKGGHTRPWKVMRCARRYSVLPWPLWVSEGLMEVAAQATQVFGRRARAIRCPSTYHWFMKVAAQAMEMILLCATQGVPPTFLWVSGGFWRWP